jgi:teichoic acid transport system permease protein
MTPTASGTAPRRLPYDPTVAAERFGLERVGARPGLRRYVGELVRRRHFIWEMARARVHTASSMHRLGRLWEPLNPLLLAAVYYLAFGVLLGARGDSDNFELFLVVGVFVWGFLAGGITAGSQSVARNRGLIRSIQFPRAVLPIAVTIKEVITFRSKLLVLVAVALATGETPALSWLVVLPAMALAAVFIAGVGFVTARLVAQVSDIGNVLPFVLRGLMYLSGLFYDVHYRLRHAPEWIQTLADLNPANVYITLVRSGFLPAEQPSTLTLWGLGVAWAFGMFAVGFVVFWRAEEHYGRG